MASSNANNQPWPIAVNASDFVTLKPRLNDSTTKYKIWREQMLCLLESQTLLGFVNDGKPDNQEETVMMTWRRRDKCVKGWILGSVGEDVLDALAGIILKDDTTARDVWLQLEKIFSERAQAQPEGQADQITSLDSEGAAEVEAKSWSSDAEGKKDGSDEEGHMQNSPTTGQGNNEDISKYLPLYKAALRGDLEAAEKFLNKDDPDGIIKIVISSRKETALHVAVGTGKANNFVKKLLELLPDEALLLRNFEGNTALHYAAKVGNTEAAMMLVNRNPDLLYALNNYNRLPVQIAAINSHKDLLLYFISKSKPDVERSPFIGQLGVRLLIGAIASQFFDVALDLVKKYPDLATLRNGSLSPLSAISQTNSAFPSGESFNWRQRLIYSCIPLRSSTSRSNEIMASVCDIENRISNAPIYVRSKWIHFTWRVPQVKSISHKKLMHQQALELVKFLSQKLECLPHEEASAIYDNSIILAAKSGIHEVVEVIIEMHPTSFFTTESETDRNIFHIAARNKLENVFNLVYRMSDRKRQIYDEADAWQDNMMHLAARLAPPDKLNLVSGAALQMQRELQWFNEMENFVSPSRRVWPNNDGKTPKVLFTEEHQTLKADGERWMKDTANSCTIAAALIATVVFAAAFTVPGGYANENGIPIFRRRFSFILFAISDAISLFTSITSLLMFLSILTSRYAEEDFLYVLPKRLSIGLLTLFISITFMMVAFCATLYLVLVEEKGRIFIPVAALASLPVTSFVLLQSPLLVDVMYSTYGPGIFGKKSGNILY